MRKLLTVYGIYVAGIILIVAVTIAVATSW